VYIDDINILQDLYDPESPPQVLKPDSIINVRINPLGELLFPLYCIQSKKFNQASPILNQPSETLHHL
jgi:hypothetical protein